MKIKLHNFRCYTDAQFDLPDFGLVLLSGDSGSGKSTLLKAILYALFGSRGVRKPYSFGTTSCSVTLEFIGMKIHRTNRPNRVVVGDLEDAAAQAFIDEKLGAGYNEFLISSYIAQKNNSSVLSLPQTEQLHMIKTLSFEQNEVYREKLKEMLRVSSDKLLEKRTEVQFSQREVDRICETLDPVKFPLGEEVDNQDEVIERYRARMRSFNTRISNLLQDSSKWNKELLDHQQAEAELDMSIEKLTDANDRLSTINTRHEQLQELLQDTPDDLELEINNTELVIRFLELLKECEVLQEQYNKVQADEEEERETRTIELEKTLWKEKDCQTATTDLEQFREQLLLWDQYTVAVKELDSIVKVVKNGDFKSSCLLQECVVKVVKEVRSVAASRILQKVVVEHYTKLIKRVEKEKERLAIAAEKLALERELVYCPECDSALRWQEGALVTVQNHKSVDLTELGDRDYAVEIKEIEKKVTEQDAEKSEHDKMLQRARAIVIPDIGDINGRKIKQEIKRLTSFIAQNKQWEEELRQIKKRQMTPALKGLRRQLDAKGAELEDVGESLPCMSPTHSIRIKKDLQCLRKDLHNLGEQLASHQKHVSEMTKITTEMNKMENKAEVYEKKVQELTRKVASINVKEIKTKITSINNDFSKAKKKQTKDEALNKKVDQFLVFREQQKELERWEKKLRQVNKQTKTAEMKHTANLTLKEKYVQAEIMALESTIGSINEHTSYYLDTFFADHQLSATLQAVYKGKKLQTLKINTVINYKGNEYDNINQMSGGEFDRCTLASICGINSMLGSPILILDESLASLDADTNTEIIRFLSDLGQDKLILVCSHEAVQGIFNVIIRVDT